MTRIEIFAPAKINLALHVVGRRADGYHLLDSLVAFADIGDDLNIESSDALCVDLAGPFAAHLNVTDNSVVKAAALLAEASGRAPGAHITLTKTLPVASGIGGGSSDAAATLLGCRKLWNAPSLPDASRIAARLGADVPVCLRRKPTHMRGIGEVLADAPPLPECAVVLVNPGMAVSTAAVFTALNGAFTHALPEMTSWRDAPDLALYLGETRNDLEAPAQALAPVISTVLERFKQHPECLIARMSGSGATCFGLFADPADADRAARALAQNHPGWWVKAGRLRTFA
jgi:4-diphosphocytidyl-2-C-methyl-D-erythritol kinase